MNNQQPSRFATHENSAYPQLWRGCVGAWCPSLGPSGSRLHDYSRRQNWGTLTNMDPATDWVVSGGQYALDFDGADDSILSTYANSTGLTVAAWVFARSINNANGEYYVTKWGPNPTAAENDFYIGSFANNWIARTGDGAGGVSTLAQSAATANKWTHLAATRDASNLRLYVDGVETSSVSAVSLQGGGAAALRMAYIFGVGYANCIMDDIRIYSRALHRELVRLLASRRGIAFTPRTRRLAVTEQAAGATNRRRRIICGSQC